jgi:hypothetical protein
LLKAKIVSYKEGTGTIDEEKVFEKVKQVNIKNVARISSGVRVKSVEIVVDDYRGANEKEGVLNIL